MTLLQNPVFQDAYARLNTRQKAAVDQIYGPVMVIAGPGTGKTQLLAVRVGQILTQTDVYAENILCLTFTDAGASAMKARLNELIGKDSYHVNVHTYHSFCNQVIRENPELFLEYRDLKNASELEMIDVMHKLIDGLPLDHEIKRLKGDVYFDLHRLVRLFSVMKQESWSPEDIQKAYEEYADLLPTLEEYIYKRKSGSNNKGDIKTAQVEKELEKYAKTVHAASLIGEYNRILKSMDRIDYNDSIHFVLKAFKENPNVLAWYRERFQFILADEYQDTNGSQNELLFLLASYDDQPNLFVVGDDDQAIYRFQGANMNNIREFKNAFDPVEVVLEENYRSDQRILDTAAKLIENNDERLAKIYDGLSKTLIESRREGRGGGSHPVVTAYETVEAQNIGIIREIHALHSAGIPYSHMAVIYRKHKEVEDLVKYLTIQNIPLNVRKKIDVLKQPDVKRIVRIFQFIEQEKQEPFSENEVLFEILHASFFNISPVDLGRISVYLYEQVKSGKSRISLREICSSDALMKEAQVRDTEHLLRAAEIIESLITASTETTLQILFEMILTRTGMLNKIIGEADASWRLQVINTFFNYIKTETAQNPDFNAGTLLEHVKKMTDNRISIPLTKIETSQDGIHFMTAHGSKGLEFDHVFIMNATEEDWIKNKGRNQDFKLPPTIVHAARESDIEDDRRLFFVALTRAKNRISICYPKLRDGEKENSRLRFIDEMELEAERISMVSETEVVGYLATLLRYEQGETTLIDGALIDRVTENMHMSATGISKYLKCKTTFYFENILRVPMARTANMGYGNAVHFALEKLILLRNKSPERKLPEKQDFLVFFKQGMDRFRSHFTREEFDSHLHLGMTTLGDYYDDRKASWERASDQRAEYVIKTEFEGIPISGIIDRIDIFSQQLIDVTDYKTGQFKYDKLAPPKPEKEDKKYGGDYWRQVVFYKMLLMGDQRHSWRLKQAIMDFVHPYEGSYKEKIYANEEMDIETVGEQLKEVYRGIKNHEFSPGCGKSDCQWCTFVRENMAPHTPIAKYAEEGAEEFEE